MHKHEVTDVKAVWGVALTAVHCAHCGEAHLVPPDEVSARCPFCLQGPLAPQPAYLRSEPPEQVLPYGVSDQNLAQILNRWSQRGWFRPKELRGETLTRRARRYFLPLWLVDGQVIGNWRADVGFDYEVVSYQDRYSQGTGWSSQEVKEERIRWEPRVGQIDRGYENLGAPALDDHRALMERLGRFDLSQRKDYDPEVVASSAVRIPTLEPEAAWPGVKMAFDQATRAECRQAAGADHIRDFTLEAKYDSLNWTLLLLPAYVTWYREGERVWPVLVNGQSGRVSGVRRADARKANVTSLILGVVGAVLFVLGGLLTLVGLPFPLLAVFGGLMLVLGVILGLTAPIPAIGAWIFNRRSAAEDGR